MLLLLYEQLERLFPLISKETKRRNLTLQMHKTLRSLNRHVMLLLGLSLMLILSMQRNKRFVSIAFFDQHTKKECLKLQGKDGAHARQSKGKEKAMHMVQRLTLDSSSKFFVVEVLHGEAQHECCVFAAMWQPTFGPHELHRMHGTINGQRVHILVDDGATHNFLDYKIIKKLNLALMPSAP